MTAAIRPMIARQQKLDRATERGARDGQLTRPEAGALQREKKGVDQLMRAVAKDGEVTKAEATQVKRAQDHLAKDVFELTHNAQRGPKLR